MKTLKKIYLLFAVSVIAILLFTSCSGDPVAPPPVDKDTVDRYEWSIDTIFGYTVYDLYIADSINAFFTSPSTLLYYDGKSYTPVNVNDPSFRFRSVDGYDKNNVFIAGHRVASNIPILKKLEMSNIYSYEITGDTGNSITELFIEGPNQAWLSISESNKIYYFNTGVFIPYTLDSGVRSGSFFRNTIGTLFYFGLKINTVYDYKFYIYKYNDNSFELFNIDSVNTNSIRFGSSRCGVDAIAQGRTSLYYFNNTYWEQFCNTTGFNPKSVCGISRNNLVCYGTKDFYEGAVYIWNGSTWYKERSKLIPADFYFSVHSELTNGNVNLIISDDNNLDKTFYLKGVTKSRKEEDE